MAADQAYPFPAARDGRRTNLLRALKEEQRQFRPSIYWYLSFRCNLACEHCSVQSSPWVDTSRDLGTDDCMQVVDQMAELGVKSALLSGGEALLRPDALEIIRALSDRNIVTLLESNGLRFSTAFAELARELQAKDLFGIGISLDGGTEDTHERLRGPRSFRRTVGNLRFLKEQGVRFNVQCVLNTANLYTIPSLYSLAQELWPECEAVQWATLHPIGRGVALVRELGLQPQDVDTMCRLVAEHAPSFPGATLFKVPPAMIPPEYLETLFGGENRMKNPTSCQFPLLGVLPNGDVTVCALSRDNEELRFGNVRDIRLVDVWHQTRMDALRSRYVTGRNLEGICGDCIWQHACKGACRALAFEEGDSFDAPYPICESMEKAGYFPDAYRISRQTEEGAKQLRLTRVGCACPAA